jgi:leucyl aminopeptidase
MDSIIISIEKNNLEKLKFYTKEENNIKYLIIKLDTNISNYKLSKNINKISKLINVANAKNIYLKFQDNDYKIISLIHNILYDYNKNDNSLPSIDNTKLNNYYKQLTAYKNIVMNPNKTQITFLEHVIKYIPHTYNIEVYHNSNNFNYSNNNNINIKLQNKMFPLCNAVNKGSTNPWLFVHISPKKIIVDALNLYLIGKSVIFDSGGMNLKKVMHDMKCDMIGGGILVSVLKNLNNDNLDKKINIHIILPIVENMINHDAVRPGNVITTNNKKTVEIVDTDAEGRLCIADALEYVNNIIKEKRNLIIDIATLTGNATQITESCSAIGISNTLGTAYLDKIIDIGEITGEYVDKLKLYEEYNEYHKSNVADIANHNYNTKSECVIAASFLNFFTSASVPWIHLDVAATTFNNNMANSWGINLLYNFIKSLI